MQKFAWSFILIFAGLLIMGAHYYERILKVSDWVSVATGTKDARVTVQSDGTMDMFSGYTTGGSEAFTVDKDGDLSAVGAAFSGNLYVDGDGISDVQVRVDGTSGQAVDILQVRLYNGTEIMDATSDGAIGLKKAVTCALTLEVVGAVTLSSTLSAASSDIAGEAAAKYVLFDSITADPCTADGSSDVPAYGTFLNSTAGELCQCDDAGSDYRIKDYTTACF